MANTNLRRASKVKNDEFYTQLADIENELRHYKDQLKDKIIFCNCDDPFESNFFKYFAMNFNQLGLKKLIATCYDPSPIANTQLSLFGDDVPIKHRGMKKFANHAYKIELDKIIDVDRSGSIGIADVEKMLANEKNTLRNGGKSDILTYLDGDGDFRSDECAKLLKQADVVITNPPFSLYRQYIAQLMKYDKQFLIVGDDNWITYKDTFTLLKSNKMWLGYGRVKEFRQPNGEMKKFGNKCWYTNLDVAKRHELLTLFKRYNHEEHPNYDNFDAIEVSRVENIPEDYDGLMGVPITFLGKYNPEQFEIIGLAADKRNEDPLFIKGKETYLDEQHKKFVGFVLNGKATYARILIKRKGNI